MSDEVKLSETEEQWRPVVGYEGLYEVSSLGRVRSVERYVRSPRGTRVVRERILAPWLRGRGRYPSVCLRKRGVAKDAFVHRLVVAAFVGLIPGGMQVNHRNGTKTDNRLENLEVVTPHENAVHAFRTGLRSNVGASHSQSKLTDDDVRAIRARLALGETGAVIAEAFGVSSRCVSSIRRGRNWAHLDASVTP